MNTSKIFSMAKSNLRWFSFYFRFADWTGSELNKFNLFNRNLGWARNWDLLSFEHLTFRDLILI